MTGNISKNLEHILPYHPEIRAGGFPVGDHIFEFFTRVRALCPESGVVLDVGAGRGRHVDELSGPRLRVRDLRSPTLTVVGCDVDSAVLENPLIDKAIVGSPDQPLQFIGDGSVDLAFSWAVLEHLVAPEAVFKDVFRVLAPGGWFCSWTPNATGYVGLSTRAVPNRFHGSVLGRLQRFRPEEDVFPTLYRANTIHRIADLAKRTGFVDHSFGAAGPSAYVSRPIALARFIEASDAALPRRWKSFLYVFLQKPF